VTKRVLIAEDEESIVASLEFLMRQCGFETRVARNGYEAIASLVEFQPDLVLLDVMLPGRSGFEVCRFIRGESGLGGVRILMLTAKGGLADQAKGRAAGVDDYLSKPFATRELVARARALLEASVR
jgi:two-component system, OmpR family, alkaline phosphatase synthesis response regulator PhoP